MRNICPGRSSLKKVLELHFLSSCYSFFPKIPKSAHPTLLGDEWRSIITWICRAGRWIRFTSIRIFVPGKSSLKLSVESNFLPWCLYVVSPQKYENQRILHCPETDGVSSLPEYAGWIAFQQYPKFCPLTSSLKKCSRITFPSITHFTQFSP